MLNCILDLEVLPKNPKQNCDGTIQCEIGTINWKQEKLYIMFLDVTTDYESGSFSSNKTKNTGCLMRFEPQV